MLPFRITICRMGKNKMRITPVISCRIQLKAKSWWVYSLNRPGAGFLLESVQEKCQFARDCGIDLQPEDLPASWFYKGIRECPKFWFDKALALR
jgi:hypothetical protein